jgi:hypothetical protein
MKGTFLRALFWRSYWFSLRRSRKDRRARTFAFNVTFLIIDVFVFLPISLWLAYREGGGFEAFVVYGAILGAAMIALQLMRRAYRRQDDALRYSLTGNVLVVPQDENRPQLAVRNYLEGRARILSALILRAASEACIDYNALPADCELVTRQTVNGSLRKSGLWERLEPGEAELMRVPAGQWAVVRESDVVVWCEQLRLLRWVLGIDREVIPLAHYPRIDFSLAAGMLEPAETSPAVSWIMDSWEVRVQRDIALEYLIRAVAEMNSRGVIAKDPELEQWTDEFREKSLGASTDYICAHETIADLDAARLQLLAMTSSARERYASYLVERLGNDAALSFAQWSERV